MSKPDAQTIRLEGRNYIVFKNAPEDIYSTVTSTYNEVILTGTNGAVYHSERWHGSTIFRFWNENTRQGYPKPVFKDNYFKFTFNDATETFDLVPVNWREANEAIRRFLAGRTVNA